MDTIVQSYTLDISWAIIIRYDLYAYENLANLSKISAHKHCLSQYTFCLSSIKKHVEIKWLDEMFIFLTQTILQMAYPHFKENNSNERTAEKYLIWNHVENNIL